MKIKRPQLGFTLIELMITVIIAVIVLTQGVPSFRSLIQNNRITAQANELVGGLNLARSEALKRGSRVSICASTDGLSCASSTNWATGWIVFGDPDGDGAVAAATDVLRSWEAAVGGTILTGDDPFLVYQGRGSVNTATEFQMSIPDGSANQTRAVCVGLAGNTWVNRPASGC